MMNGDPISYLVRLSYTWFFLRILLLSHHNDIVIMMNGDPTSYLVRLSYNWVFSFILFLSILFCLSVYLNVCTTFHDNLVAMNVDS